MNLKTYTNIKIYFLFLVTLIKRDFIKFLLKNMKFSKSQVYQDLFIIYYSKLKTNGKFIEIGGGNGIDLSNTYLHEKNYKWNGIICEPDSRSHKKIKNNREAILEKKAVSNLCKKNIIFYKNNDPYSSSLKKIGTKSKQFVTNTICLNHLIEFYNFGNNIDYISIDTEGNELDIIKKFNFKKYKVNFFTIEHNFKTKMREKIFKIMKRNGFKRVFKYLSYMDDWYINIKIDTNDDK